MTVDTPYDNKENEIKMIEKKNSGGNNAPVVSKGSNVAAVKPSNGLTDRSNASGGRLKK